MKRSIIISLIVSGSLLALGIILFITAMAISGFKFAEVFTTASYDTVTHDINDDFDSISINTTTADVKILPSKNGTTRVVCPDNKKLTHIVEVTDGALSIEGNDERRWFDHLSIVNNNSPEISVYLPKEEYEALSIDLATGDVRVGKFTFSSVNIEVTTGDVECLASSVGEIKIHATTGDIGVSGASAGSIDLKSTSGLVNIFAITSDGNINIKSTTGKSILTKVACKNLTINSGSGDSKMKNVIVSETISIDKTTGDVEFDACDAADLKIKVTTGSVEGTLLTGKVFITHTTTGDIEVPRTIIGGICEITTTTGDVEIEISK